MKTDRIESLARELAARETRRITARRAAEERIHHLHDAAVAAVSSFDRIVGEEGASHLGLLRVGPVKPDDRSVRAFQFTIRRGRHRTIVITKDREDMVLVGPFKVGHLEAPCRTLHHQGNQDPSEQMESALEQLLVDLITESFSK